MNRRRPAAGFTLLELIIVVAIFALFSVMAYGGLNAVLKSRAEVERLQDRLAEQQRAYMRLRDDLQQVWWRPVRDAYGDAIPALRGTDSPVVLEFTRGGWRNPALLRRSTLERVLYRLEERRLIRSTFRVLDQSQDSRANDAVLLTEVDALRLRYLDAQRVWHSRWPPESADVAPARQPPPAAVEITLETRDQGELLFLFKVGADHVVIPPTAAGSDGRTPAPKPTPDGDQPGNNPVPTPVVPSPVLPDPELR